MVFNRNFNNGNCNKKVITISVGYYNFRCHTNVFSDDSAIFRSWHLIKQKATDFVNVRKGCRNQLNRLRPGLRNTRNVGRSTQPHRQSAAIVRDGESNGTKPNKATCPSDAALLSDLSRLSEMIISMLLDKYQYQVRVPLRDTNVGEVEADFVEEVIGIDLKNGTETDQIGCYIRFTH